MSNITFVRTRHVYQSYTDFWHLVELSGYPTCYVDEVDPSFDRIFIVSPMNGEWRQMMDAWWTTHDNKQATLICWNLERPGGSGSLMQYRHDNQDLIDAGYLDRVLVSDRALAKATGLSYVPLGGHPGLGEPGTLGAKQYDLIHLSCYSNRRSFMFQTPSQPKTTLFHHLSVAPNGWGEARHKALQQTAFMLNVHQDEFPFMEPLRFILAAAYGLPIISEPCEDAWPYTRVPGAFMQFSLRDMYQLGIEYDEHTHEAGKTLRRMFCNTFTFKSQLEQFL